jgi:hypothetical protein
LCGGVDAKRDEARQITDLVMIESAWFSVSRGMLSVQRDDSGDAGVKGRVDRCPL